MNYRNFWSAVCCLLPLCAASAAWGATFPPITDAEKNLTELPGQPEAPAVVLFEKAEVKIQDYPKEVSSFLKVNVRVKILTEEGKSFGEEEIHHSGFYRLKKIEGRTVLPDGTVVPLPEDAIFTERRSRSLKRFVTKLVFPSVEVGAILDYHYEVRWDSLFFLEPWYFHNRVPTLLSEINYIKPNNMALDPWGIQAGAQKMQSTSDKTSLGSSIRIWVEDLPGVPEEDFGFPFSDLSSRFMMVPKRVIVNGERVLLMDSWISTCDLFEPYYVDFLRKDRDSKKKAVELTQGLKDRNQKIAAIHAFVRDEIQNVPDFGVGVAEEARADVVLKQRRGTAAEKALLLQGMLAGIKIEGDLLWVADRTEGRIDLSVANPYWFDSLMVKVGDGAEAIYLDPNDRRSGFNHIPPFYEGMAAVQFDKKKPLQLELPSSTHGDNHRQAKVDLVVDEDGALSGSGELRLKGQEAWRYTHWKDTAEETASAWQEWLQDQHEGFDIADVTVTETPIEQHIAVSWNLTQRPEEVLGDEVTVQPALPLGPVTQIFSLPPEIRKTPVQLLFARSEDVTTTVTWPEGWQIDLQPVSRQHGGVIGYVSLTSEIDEEARKATFYRHFERTQTEFVGSDTYGALRDLYAQAAETDALALVLISE